MCLVNIVLKRLRYMGYWKEQIIEFLLIILAIFHTKTGTKIFTCLVTTDTTKLGVFQ